MNGATSWAVKMYMCAYMYICVYMYFTYIHVYVITCIEKQLRQFGCTQ